MKIEKQRVGTVDVLAPCGALVDQEVELFQKELHARVDAPNARVVIDMNDVPYLDSEAAEVLLDAADQLSERASALKLARVQATCREIFELTGVARQFSFFASVQDAVRSFL